MPQDYAKRAADHKQKMSHNNRSPVSKGLLGITIILMAGFVGFLYYLTQIKPGPNNSATQKSESVSIDKTPRKAAVKKAPLVEQSQPEDEYDFYRILPESEVIPPQVEEYKSTPIGEVQQKSFLLQAGSFRNYEDADRLRAKLILKGLEVQIKLIRNGSASKWHRVLVGPYKSRSKLNQAQDILVRANTEFMLVEVKE